MTVSLTTSNLRITCDMGESYGPWIMGADDSLMPWIDLASIACGMHASDPVTMARTIALAAEHSVVIGAHPGYPDRVGFGRRPFPLDGDELIAYLQVQIGALDALCRAQGQRVAYVKPHGALYNRMMQDAATLTTVMQAVAELGVERPLVIQAGAPADNARHQQQADHFGLSLWFEAFADRAYGADGRLLPRQQPGAVLDSVEAILDQVRQLVASAQVTTPNGQHVPVAADCLCVHGDNPLAPTALQALRSAA